MENQDKKFGGESEKLLTSDLKRKDSPVELKDRTTPPANEVSSLSEENETPDTEKGWGWVIVFASFIVYFIVFGSLRCQSVLFVPIINAFQSDYSNVGWVSATATAGLSVSGLISALLMEKIGHRPTIMIGGVVACLASVSSAFAPSLLVLDLTAGLLTGIGLGISFVASPVIIGLYFMKRRALATNIASMGGSIGTFFLCPLNGFLVNTFGIRGYYILFGGIFLQLSVVGALMRPVSLTKSLSKISEPPKRPPSFDDKEVAETSQHDCATTSQEAVLETNLRKAEENAVSPCRSLMTDIPYIVYCLSQIVFLAGFLVGQLYIVPFAEKELDVPTLKASIVLSVAAVTELISRIIFGILGDVERINRLLMFASVLMALAICGFILPFTTSFETLTAVAAVAGLFQGGFSGISVVVLADIVGIKLYGTALGISTLLNGIGTLIAPPLVGLAVDQTGKPSVALLISAGILLVGAVLTLLIQVALKFRQGSPHRPS